MGRLLKKKPDDKKKKKKRENLDSSVSSAANGKEVTSSVKNIKKIDTSATRKSAQGAKSVPRGELNIFQKSIQFLREVKVELKKVTWPSRTQTIGSTTVVLILVMIISFFLGIADMGLSNLFRLVLQ